MPFIYHYCQISKRSSSHTRVCRRYTIEASQNLSCYNVAKNDRHILLAYFDSSMRVDLSLVVKISLVTALHSSILPLILHCITKMPSHCSWRHTCVCSSHVTSVMAFVAYIFSLRRSNTSKSLLSSSWIFCTMTIKGLFFSEVVSQATKPQYTSSWLRRTRVDHAKKGLGSCRSHVRVSIYDGGWGNDRRCFDWRWIEIGTGRYCRVVCCQSRKTLNHQDVVHKRWLSRCHGVLERQC